MTIYFYNTIGEYGCFSNFSSHGFELDGLYWRTNEHYFQAQKFLDDLHKMEIYNCKTPKDAAKKGRERSRPLRTDWEQVKDDIMRKGVLHKFETHPEIGEILLATGDKEIIENAPGDYYWGCGKDGSGKNMLGKILVEVRQLLRQRQK